MIQNFQSLDPGQQQQLIKILQKKQQSPVDIKLASSPTKETKKEPVPPSLKNIVTKYAFATRVGYMPGNPNKQNQDSFILHPNFKKSYHTHMFGVCDGHGHLGREVSNFVKQYLPQALEEHDKYEDAFLDTDSQLNNQIDTHLSGTTVVVVIFEGNKLICLNAGDSRAIKASVQIANGVASTDASELTTDHKPELAKERERILAAGGRIKAFTDH